MSRNFFGPVLGAAALVATAVSAQAADLPVKAPPLEVFTWAGFYIGGNAGGAWGRDQVTTTQIAPAPFLPIDTAAISSAASTTISPFGFAGGVQAGYNLQQGHWVWGSEVDFGYLGLKASNAGTFPFPSTLPGGPIGPPTAFFSTTASMSTSWLFTGRERLGWAADHWLVYVTGGLAVGKENFSQTITLLAPFVETASFSSTSRRLDGGCRRRIRTQPKLVDQGRISPRRLGLCGSERHDHTPFRWSGKSWLSSLDDRDRTGWCQLPLLARGPAAK